VLRHFSFAVNEEFVGLRGLELEKPPPKHGISEEGFWRRRNGTSRESWLNISAVTVVPGISFHLKDVSKVFSGESIVPRFFHHSLTWPCSGPFYNRHWHCNFCWLTLISPQLSPYKPSFSLQSLIPISPLIHHHTLVKPWSLNPPRISS
jgi:hypothetical protein